MITFDSSNLPAVSAGFSRSSTCEPGHLQSAAAGLCYSNVSHLTQTLVKRDKHPLGSGGTADGSDPLTFQIHSDDRWARFGHKHLTVLRQQRSAAVPVEMDLMKATPSQTVQLVYSSHQSNRFLFLALWARRFTGLSSQCLKWPCFVIIRLANHRHRASFPNILIQFGRASKASFPSHDLHWFIIFVFIFTLFIGVNVSLTSPIIMPEVNDVTRCTWFTNVNRSWATLAKHADSYLWLAEDSPPVVLSAEPCKLHWALLWTTKPPQQFWALCIVPSFITTVISSDNYRKY